MLSLKYVIRMVLLLVLVLSAVVRVHEKCMFGIFLFKRDQALWLLRGYTLNLLWGGVAIHARARARGAPAATHTAPVLGAANTTAGAWVADVHRPALAPRTTVMQVRGTAWWRHHTAAG